MDNTLVKNKKKFDVIPLLVFILLYIAESVGSVLFFDFDAGEYKYITSVTWSISKVIPLFIAILIYHKRFSSLGKETGKAFKKFLIYSLASFAIFYLFEIGISYYQMFMDKLFGIGEATNQESIYAYFNESDKFINYLLLFITIVILAPLLEEFEFRELIFKTFGGCHFLIPTIISSLLFGLMHLHFYDTSESGQLYIIWSEFAYYPIYFLPGFVLALIYHYSGNNFYASFLVHMTSNLISFVMIIAQ